MHSRRTTELWLLIAAAPVMLLLFLMLLVNQGSDITLANFAVPLGLIAAFVPRFMFSAAPKAFAAFVCPASAPADGCLVYPTPTVWTPQEHSLELHSPVLPKPLSPRSVSCSSLTSRSFGVMIGRMTSCVIFMPLPI